MYSNNSWCWHWLFMYWFFFFIETIRSGWTVDVGCFSVSLFLFRFLSRAVTTYRRREKVGGCVSLTFPFYPLFRDLDIILAITEEMSHLHRVNVKLIAEASDDWSKDVFGQNICKTRTLAKNNCWQYCNGLKLFQ